jgi:hypothetical protein
LVAVAHGLAGAAWFGAMFYSLYVLQPRARRYFPDLRQLESFITTLSHGGRWQVLGAFGIVGSSGIGLFLLHMPDSMSVAWLWFVCAKLALFLAAFALFVHVSWRLWPARVLATHDEIPQFQKKSRQLARLMLLLIGLSMVAGICMHAR